MTTHTCALKCFSNEINIAVNPNQHPRKPEPTNQERRFQAEIIRGPKPADLPGFSGDFGEIVFDMPQITFRIADDVAQQLNTALRGSTRAEFARNALMAALDGQSLAEVNRGLTALHGLLKQQHESQRKADLGIAQNVETFVREIEDLRGDLATTVVGILTRIGTAVPQDEAEQFVRRTLLGETPEETN